jgi:hypothetical protein
MGAGGEPVLLLEDGGGRRVPVGAAELLGWARATPGGQRHRARGGRRLLDHRALAGWPLPGSSSAQPHAAPAAAAGRALGLAEHLVAGASRESWGCRARSRTREQRSSQAVFYAAMGCGADLMAGLRACRGELAAKGRPHEWAVPVLLTRRGAGPLAAPEGSTPPVATPVAVARRELEIAGVSYLGEGYAGRRDRERLVVQAVARGERLLVVHGLGGIGKLTFAARFVERRRAAGARVLVLPADRTLKPAPLIEAIAAALGVAAHPTTEAFAATGAETASRFRRALATASSRRMFGSEPIPLSLFESSRTLRYAYQRLRETT